MPPPLLSDPWRLPSGGPILCQITGHKSRVTALLDYVEARQNGNFLAGGDVRAVSGHHQEAVGLRQGGDIAGTLPVQRLHLRRDAGPFETGWKKVCEARLFVQSFDEGGLKQGELPRRRAAEDVDRGNHEQLESDHGGDGISRQAEYQRVAAATEDRGLARADGHGIKIKFRAQA